MSKYNLSDLLNEITGTGRIGTYIATYRELVNKVDELEEKGIKVKELGMSGDGKTPFEFEIYPGDKDEAFSVYPYKFDPRDEDDMEIFRFSIGGKPVAIRAAKELLGDGAYSNAEIKDGLKQLDDAGDDTSDFSDLKEQDDAEGFVDELQEANEDYDLLKIKKEIRFHLDTYEKGIIDGDDLAKAVEEVVFGDIKAPGMREDTAMSGAVADELEAGAIGDRVEESFDSLVKKVDKEKGYTKKEAEKVAGAIAAKKMKGAGSGPTAKQKARVKEDKMAKIDLANITKTKYNNAITSAKDFADAILDIWNELEPEENDAIFNNMALKNSKSFLEKASSAKKEVEESVTEDMFGPVKFLKSKGIDDDIIKDFMKTHSKDIVGASEDEIMDEFENFRSVNYDYIDENLKEHFGRFMKDYQ